MSIAELHDDLEEHMTGFPAATGEEHFTVDSLEKADWAARKIARSRRRLAEASAVAQAERARIDEWEMEQIRRCETDSAYLLELLHRYHRHLLDDDPKAKTVPLPGGSQLVARKQPDTFIDDGGEDTLEWAEQNAPELVIVRKAIDKTKAKKHLLMSDVERPEGFVALDPETRETVPGAWFRKGDVKFSLKTEVDQ